MPSLADLLGITTPDTSIFGGTASQAPSSAMYQPPSLMDLIRDPSDPQKSKIIWNAPQAPYAPSKASSSPPQMQIVPQSPTGTGTDVTSPPMDQPQQSLPLSQIMSALGSILSPATVAAINNIPGLQFQIPTTSFQQPPVPQGTVSVIEDPAQIAALLKAGGISGGMPSVPAGSVSVDETPQGIAAAQGGSQYAPGSMFSQINVSPAQSVPDYTGLTGQFQGQTDPSSWFPSTAQLAQYLTAAAAGALVPGGGSAVNAAWAAAPGLAQTAAGEQNLTSSPSSQSWWQQAMNFPSTVGAGFANWMSDLFGTGDTNFGTSQSGITAGPGDQVMNSPMQTGSGPNQQYSPSNNTFGIFGGSIDQSNPWGGGMFELMLPGSGGGI